MNIQTKGCLDSSAGNGNGKLEFAQDAARQRRLGTRGYRFHESQGRVGLRTHGVHCMQLKINWTPSSSWWVPRWGNWKTRKHRNGNGNGIGNGKGCPKRKPILARPHESRATRLSRSSCPSTTDWCINVCMCSYLPVWWKLSLPIYWSRAHKNRWPIVMKIYTPRKYGHPGVPIFTWFQGPRHDYRNSLQYANGWWVIPCQINAKKSLPSSIWTKLGFYTVSVEILTHSEFQRSAMYGFRVRTRQKNWFFGNFLLTYCY